MSYKTPITEAQIEANFQQAAEQYAAYGVDIDQAVDRALEVPISLHCWQADDVAGFEVVDEAVEGGGIMATGNYPGRARDGEELRQDLKKVVDLLPGSHRANVHAFYCDTGGQVVDRDALEPKHFAGWVDWAKEHNIGIDFNPTYFAHPKANDGFTLSHSDKGIRDFWIQHAIASRRISEAIGKALDDEVVNNHWVPDGVKDHPADRWSPRERLVEAFDAIFDDSLGIGPECIDAVEGKLFGLGMEDYTVGSNDFYANYALSRGKLLCLDMGHFHPTESIADKLSAHFAFHKKLLIHTSRPIRWDSDHVVLLTDDVRNVFLELARHNAIDRMYLALDFFDASINRIAAYVIGTRATRKALLYGVVDPTKLLRQLEAEGKHAQKLGLMEDMKTMPFSAVWDMCCLKANVPVGASWIDEVETYERDVLSKRN
jgi:L-rhamnose isomerase